MEKESLSVLNKKIGNKIIQKISNNSLGSMGLSFDILALEKIMNEYSQQYHFDEFQDNLDDFLYDYNISKDDLLKIFDGNFVFSINDIDMRNEYLDGIFVAGLGNSDQLINIIHNLSINGEFPTDFPKIYKNEIIDITSQDQVKRYIY